jgi:hypothetical protein
MYSDLAINGMPESEILNKTKTCHFVRLPIRYTLYKTVFQTPIQSMFFRRLFEMTKLSLLAAFPTKF